MRHVLMMIGAVVGLAGCMPSGPVFGSWAGETRGPVSTGLTLYESPDATSGQYLIQITVAGTQIGGGSGLTTWSGPWVAERSDGRSLIRLEDPLSSMINRYRLTQSRTMEPAPDYFNGRLSPGQIREYSLYPIAP